MRVPLLLLLSVLIPASAAAAADLRIDRQPIDGKPRVVRISLPAGLQASYGYRNGSIVRKNPDLFDRMTRPLLEYPRLTQVLTHFFTETNTERMAGRILALPDGRYGQVQKSLKEAATVGDRAVVLWRGYLFFLAGLLTVQARIEPPHGDTPLFVALDQLISSIRFQEEQKREREFVPTGRTPDLERALGPIETCARPAWEELSDYLRRGRFREKPDATGNGGAVVITAPKVFSSEPLFLVSDGVVDDALSFREMLAQPAGVKAAVFGDPGFDVRSIGGESFPWTAFLMVNQLGQLRLKEDRRLDKFYYDLFLAKTIVETPELRTTVFGEISPWVNEKFLLPALALESQAASAFALDALAGCL